MYKPLFDELMRFGLNLHFLIFFFSCTELHRGRICYHLSNWFD